MHTLHAKAIRRITLILAGAMLAAVAAAQGASGTWTQITAGSASGTWSDAATGNWSGGVVAGGSGFTADFSTLNITASSTIALGEPRTIGNIIFGDTDTSTAGVSWVLSNGGNALNILTLAGPAPTITTNALGTNSLTTISAVLDGTNGLTKDGSGLLALAAANTYSGGTTVSLGTLRSTNNSAFGSGAVTVVSGASLQVQGSLTMGNTINLNGSAAFSVVSGANVLSGTVNLQSASTLAMGSDASASLAVGTLNLGANQLTVTGSRPLTLGGAIGGTGILNLTNTGGTTTMTNDNSATYSGQIKVVRSTLAVGNDGALGTGGVVLGVNDQASGIRSLDTNTRTIGNALSLVGSTNSTFVFGSTTASANGDLNFTNAGNITLPVASTKFVVNNRTEFDGAFTGSGGITTQTGAGTLALAGTNTYTGPTAVNAGSVYLSGSINGTSQVNLNGGSLLLSRAPGEQIKDTAPVSLSGGTLAFNDPANQIETLGALTLSANSVVDFGLGGGNDSLLFAGLTSHTAGTTLTIQNWIGNTAGGTNGANDRLVFSGAYTNFTNVFNQADVSFTGYGAGYAVIDFGGTSYEIVAVPEPSSAVLIGSAALLGLVGFRGRRRRVGPFGR